MTMPTRRAARRATLIAAAALAVTTAGIGWSNTAAATTSAAPATHDTARAGSGDAPQNPVTKAVLDAIWPTPPFEDDGEFSDSERIAGLLGLNEIPGGPLGWWPRPANPTAGPSYGAIPGAGPYGDLSGATGITPRTPYSGGHTDTPDKIALNPAPAPALCGAPAECLLDLALVPAFWLVAPPQQGPNDPAPADSPPPAPGRSAAVRTVSPASGVLPPPADALNPPVDALLDPLLPHPDAGTGGESTSAPAQVDVPAGKHHRHHG